jgi:hypothetical protein
MGLFDFTATPESVTVLAVSSFSVLLTLAMSADPAKVVIGSFKGMKKSQAGGLAHYMNAFFLITLGTDFGFMLLAFGHSMMSAARVSFTCFALYITYATFVGSPVKAPGYTGPPKIGALFQLPVIAALWFPVFAGTAGAPLTKEDLAEELIAIALFCAWLGVVVSRHKPAMWRDAGDKYDDDEELAEELVHSEDE